MNDAMLISFEDCHIVNNDNASLIQRASNYIWCLVSGQQVPLEKNVDVQFLRNIDISSLVAALQEFRNFTSNELLGTEIIRLLSHYPNKMDDQIYEMYLRDWLYDLSEFPIWSVKQACIQWRQTSVYRPKIAEIRGLSMGYIQEFDNFIHFTQNVSIEKEYENLDEEALQIRKLLSDNFPCEVFNNWLKDVKISVKNNIISLETTTKFKERYIRENLLSGIRDCISFYRESKVRVVVTSN